MEIPARVPGATGNGATRPDMRNPSMIGLEAIHHEFKPLVALPHTNSPHKPVLNSPVWISSSRAIPLPRRQLPGACNLTLLQAQAQLRGLSRRIRPRVAQGSRGRTLPLDASHYRPSTAAQGRCEAVVFARRDGQGIERAQFQIPMAAFHF